jgi:hypothetical protein
MTQHTYKHARTHFDSLCWLQTSKHITGDFFRALSARFDPVGSSYIFAWGYLFCLAPPINAGGGVAGKIKKIKNGTHTFSNLYRKANEVDVAKSIYTDALILDPIRTLFYFCRK